MYFESHKKTEILFFVDKAVFIQTEFTNFFVEILM